MCLPTDKLYTTRLAMQELRLLFLPNTIQTKLA